MPTCDSRVDRIWALVVVSARASYQRVKPILLLRLALMIGFEPTIFTLTGCCVRPDYTTPARLNHYTLSALCRHSV